MSTQWNAVYANHDRERKFLPPDQFTTQDRSHLASRISLAGFDSGFAAALRGLGRIVATDHIEVEGGFRPTRVRGVRALQTEAAHRSSGCIWVRVSKLRDGGRFDEIASRIPQRFVGAAGLIKAPLHLFARSKGGAAILLGTERAATVLPRWENRLNSYMEGHGERQARNELLWSVDRLHSTSPATIAAYTIERLYGKFVPDLTRIATEMTAFYDARAKETRQDKERALAGRAEEYRDFIAALGRKRELPPVGPTGGIVPAASFSALERAISAIVNVERAPSPAEVVEGWPESPGQPTPG